MAGGGVKMEKNLTSIQNLIADGQFFDAQQKTRTVVARLIKAKSWDTAVDVLYNLSQSLLKAGKGGEAGDLAVLLVDVYKLAEIKPDAASKCRLLTLLRMFDGDEPTRKRFASDMIGWSKLWGYPYGDSELHHVLGSLYAQEGRTVEAEQHLLLGTKDSAQVLIKMEYDWYKEDESHTAPAYAFRAILNYLLVGNVRAANTCYRTFTDALSADNKGLGVQHVSSQDSDLRVFPSLPLLNFLGLLLLAVQKGSPELFRQLRNKYAVRVEELDDGAWNEALDMIADMYFGIQRPRQGNALFDMMGTLLGGGAPAGARKPPSRRIEAPAAEGLD